MLRLHDTATGRLEDLEGRDPGSISLYVCGSTVYGSPHVGHGRFALVYDVLRRYLESTGVRVNHVSNVTDIDDKIIAKANAEARPWQEIAERYDAEWWETMDALSCLRPSVTPHATDFVAQMVELVAELVGLGSAYETSDGVYLEVSSVSDYGLLARQSLDSLRSGARVTVNEQKRSPLDFALWKKAKPGEPTWKSPFGPGRPGWHTECVVMSLAILGDGFDLHGGGQDLVFPHHENERAQAVASGRRFSRHWMHHGMVEQSGEKMSKSLGNVMTLAEMLESTDPRAYRLLVLQSHYRAPIEVSPDNLADSRQALSRVDALQRRLASVRAAPPDPDTGVHGDAGKAALGRTDTESQTIRTRFGERMDDDLDTPGAMSVLFDGLRRANSLLDAKRGLEGAAVGGAVGEGFARVGLVPVATSIPEAVLQLTRRREHARIGRDYAAADRLRAEIEALGFAVEDADTGSRVHRR